MGSRKLTNLERKAYIKQRTKKGIEVTFLKKNLNLKELSDLKKLDKESKLKLKIKGLLRR